MLRRPKQVRSATPPSRTGSKYVTPTPAPRKETAAQPAADLTLRKGPVSVPVHDTDEPAEPASGRRMGLVVGSAVVLLLIVAVAVGIGLSKQGDETAENPQPSTPTDIGDVVDGFEPLLAPPITVAEEGGVITFSATPAEPGDTFAWRFRVDGQTDYQNVPAEGDGLHVTIASATTACVELRVRRGGALSDPAEKCWP